MMSLRPGLGSALGRAVDDPIELGRAGRAQIEQPRFDLGQPRCGLQPLVAVGADGQHHEGAPAYAGRHAQCVRSVSMPPRRLRNVAASAAPSVLKNSSA